MAPRLSGLRWVFFDWGSTLADEEGFNGSSRATNEFEKPDHEIRNLMELLEIVGC